MFLICALFVSNNVFAISDRNIFDCPLVCSDSHVGKICRHSFGGESIIVSIPSSHAQQVWGRLYIVASALKKPISEWMLLCSDNCNLQSQYSYSLPNFQRKTVIEVVIASDRKSGSIIDGFYIQVYPKDILSPIINWSKLNYIVLDEAKNLLGDFLKKHNIQFYSVSQTRHIKGKKLYLTVSSNMTYKTGNVINFTEKFDTYPYVKHKVKENRHIISVYFPMLSKLDEPLAQALLVKLFNHLP